MTTSCSEKKIEFRLVLALTALGALLRLWAPGRMGLDHFDEGVYALTGAWIGHGGLDPVLIPYAPAIYPLLVGLAYLVLGVQDLTPILVSAAAGTATIPLVAGLSRRAFGPGAGVAAAALAAISGPHVAFSRMALTDALALLTWLMALSAGGWFLNRPGLVRSMALGLAVGLAQNVKYSGFLSGIAVALAALATSNLWGRAAIRQRILALTWGALSAIVAALTYWPWYTFVERHGGYAQLMEHHRGYVGGWSSWASHFQVQMAEQTALAGRVQGPIAWTAIAWSLACLGVWLVQFRATPERSRWPRALVLPPILLLGFVPSAAWWITLARVPFWIRSRSALVRLLGLAWVVQAVLTPLYHPYARLWLPLEALGWFALAEVALILSSEPSPRFRRPMVSVPYEQFPGRAEDVIPVPGGKTRISDTGLTPPARLSGDRHSGASQEKCRPSTASPSPLVGEGWGGGFGLQANDPVADPPVDSNNLDRLPAKEPSQPEGGLFQYLSPSALALATSMGAALLFAVLAIPSTRPWAGLLGPSDGLKRATDRIAERIETAREAGRFAGAKVLARPPVLFYLVQKGVEPIARVENLETLLALEGSTIWAIEDSDADRGRETRTERRRSGWKVEAWSPAPLTTPAQLDLDPASALRSESSRAQTQRGSGLTLLRPSP